MAGKSKSLFDNAEKIIKSSLYEGDFGFSTEDGQVFARTEKTVDERFLSAQNYAFGFKPALEIKKVEGSKKLKTSS